MFQFKYLNLDELHINRNISFPKYLRAMIFFKYLGSRHGDREGVFRNNN